MGGRRSSQPGPVRLIATSHSAFRPGTRGLINAGLWAERRRLNREVSVPEAWNRLHEAGNFHNLELAAGFSTGDYVNDLPFLDSVWRPWTTPVTGWTTW